MGARLCCPGCRLRFSPAAAQLQACPDCGEPLRARSLPDLVGFGLFRPDADALPLPHAAAASISVPDPGGARP
jgi:hypothetical protein